MGARLWSDVAVAVQSALATAIGITSISNADPGVLAHGGADPTVGEYVLLTDVVGMTELNNRVFRVAAVVASTSFELESEDTTDFATFVSGNFQVITMATSLGTVRGVNASGGEANMKDTTTIHDKIETQIPGAASALVYSLENRWQPEDAGLAALRAASNIKAQRVVRFTFSDGAVSVFYGYVSATGVAGGSAQDLVTTPVTFTAAGLPTNYAS